MKQKKSWHSLLAVLICMLFGLIPTWEVAAMETIYYCGDGKTVVSVPHNEIRGIRWIIRKGKKILQQQRFGIPSDFKYRSGDNVVEYHYYWEDVPLHR